MKRLLACAALLAVAAIGVPVATAATASAGGGNSANAHLCQNGGWMTLVRSEDLTPFTDQDACVSYAAHGGVLRTLPICLNSSQILRDDIKLVGPVDTLNNLEVYPSTDGTCSGTLVNASSYVQAADAAGATAECMIIQNTPTTGNMVSDFGYTSAPSDFWVCEAVV